MKSKTSSPPAISNAGPLIHLAKANALPLLKALYQTVIIPQEVKTETVDKGKQQGAPDALQIEKAIQEGWIKTTQIKLNKEFYEASKTAGLHTAEATVMQYAHQNQITALLDDEPARTFAKTLGIPTRGTLGILIQATKNQIITQQKALKLLDKISEIMYLNAQLYKLTRKTIQEQ